MSYILGQTVPRYEHQIAQKNDLERPPPGPPGLPATRTSPAGLETHPNRPGSHRGAAPVEGRTLARVSALAITVTELRLIATPAITGFRSHPVNG